MSLTVEDLYKLTPENAKEAFTIVGLQIPQLSQLKIFIKAKLYKRYTEGTEEQKKRIEDLVRASNDTQKEVEVAVKVEPKRELDVSSPLFVYSELLDSGELVFRNLDNGRINEQFEYDGEKFTLIMALTKYILKRNKPYNWKDLESLLLKYKIDFNVIVDGRTVEDVILSTNTDGLNQENIKNISALISILLLNGFKFTHLDGPMKELVNKITVFKKLYLPPVPSSACQYSQNWQTGDFKGIKLPDHITPDYFYCGEYYFDGRYVVVKFPNLET